MNSRFDSFRLPFALVCFMTAIHILGMLGIGGDMRDWGNVPRSTIQPWGILTSHLRHADWAHLLSNALPLIALAGVATLVAPKAARRTWWVLPILSGILLWIWGRTAVHIGASTLVYGWFFFLLGIGIMGRSGKAFIGMLVALGLFGGLIWVWEAAEGISWEAHLAGATAGMVSAWSGRRLDRKTSPTHKV